ncbi:hypothetical protein OF83DRAFT_798714 [Amylostereum chailletii]|nr:hypothetical protein OF83DRAFT_798714 [Amylostereum chailletii]
MATTFDTCPVDILHLILDDACTDAGDTAQTLSLTSRHLSAVSSSYRHRNIVLRGLAQVQRVVRYFSVLPQECRRVQHLFIADDPEEYLSMDKPTCLNPGAPRRDEGRGGDGVFHGELFQAATDELLDLLAPTLRTLACHTVNPWQKFILSNVQEIHFPRLTSLILHQTTRVPFPQHDQPIGVNMPNLRRLHLSYSGHFIALGRGLPRFGL